jgi:hypothetical protein
MRHCKLTSDYIYRHYFRHKKFLGFKSVKSDYFYRTLHDIRQRCHNPNATGYKYYGGRGIGFLITIDEIIKLWIRDKAWLLKRPSIDRKDNDGHYTYENCRFIELSENVKKSNIDRKNRKKVINYLKNQQVTENYSLFDFF